MTTTQAIGYAHNLPVTDADSLIEREVQLAELGPHDLLVDVQAVSVNPVDVKLRAGAPADGFRVLGFDAAGVVRAVGERVSLFTPGDEVMYAGSITRPGTNQRQHLVDERIVGRKPFTLPFQDAASLPLTMITAWESLFEHLALSSQSAGTLLVVGATGGVGSAMVQLAEALLPDVAVIATASDADRAAWVRKLGAEHTVNHREDLAAQVLDIVPGGVDWLFTAHSEGQTPVYAKIVRPFGRIVAIDDGPRDVAPLKDRSISWHWEFMFTRAKYETDDMIAQHNLLNEVADLVDEDRIRPTVTHAFSPITPDTLREAHELVESNRTLGKVVVAGWNV